MTRTWQAVSATLGLALAMLALMEAGWRWGRRRKLETGESAAAGLSVIDSGIYGLLGLLLAFSFGSAQSRLETRRHHIVEEINAVGTAYARFDVLEPADRDRLRVLTQAYMDSRQRVYADLSDRDATERAIAASTGAQRRVWDATAAAVRRARLPAAAFLVVPAVGAMFDAATPRTVALDARTPKPIWALLLTLAPLCALLAGFAMADRRERSPQHMLLFAVIISATFYVTVDLDSPRFGMIRLRAEERLLEELRAGMK